ncbi:MAG: hypothetical protein ACI8WY_002646 [Planctomycetota bacterium]
MIGSFESHPHQLEKRSQESLGVEQGEVEYETEGPRGIVRKVRELGLRTSTLIRLGLPYFKGIRKGAACTNAAR